MSVIDFSKIIEQEFESEKQINFHIKGRDAFCTAKIIDFSVRSKIERLNQVGVDGVYTYSADGKLVQSKNQLKEEWVEMQEKIFDLIVGNGLFQDKQNLKDGAMTVRDWKKFATYFPVE